MGNNVKNSQGETLGQINDFVVNPSFGRIQFVIISISDPAQIGKMTAVPWMLAKPNSDASSLMLSVDKEKLISAQTFDATSWPDFSQASWSREIYSYYGIQPPLQSGQGGGVPTHDSESGRGPSKNLEPKHDSDKEVAPDGRGVH